MLRYLITVLMERQLSVPSPATPFSFKIKLQMQQITYGHLVMELLQRIHLRFILIQPRETIIFPLMLPIVVPIPLLLSRLPSMIIV